MKVLLYKAEGNFVDKLIKWWTSPHKFNGEWKYSYSHVELLFSDGQMFSASQYENSTRYKRYVQNGHWYEVYLPLNAYEEGKVRAFCDSVVGKKYDYLGVLGFVVGSQEHKDKWFCSEVVVAALQKATMFLTKTPSKMSPNDVARHLGVL